MTSSWPLSIPTVVRTVTAARNWIVGLSGPWVYYLAGNGRTRLDRVPAPGCG